jgi:hypothetical protein
MTTYQGQLVTLTLPEFGLPTVEPAIQATVYRERMTAFRQRAHAEGYDVAIVYGDREHFANLAYLTGYDPRSPVSVVADPLRMVRLAHTLLYQNRHLPQIATTGDKRRGRSLWIYGKRGERCPRCRTPIAYAELGEQRRSAYWCPFCQPPR